MKMVNSYSPRRRSLLPALFAFAALALSGQPFAPGRALAGPPPADCEGDACSSIVVTFDEAKGQYRAQNNSEQWARVTASNVAASSSVCLAPGKAAHLALKSIVGPYRAAYAPARCGEEDAAGPPDAE